MTQYNCQKPLMVSARGLEKHLGMIDKEGEEPLGIFKRDEYVLGGD
jgi:hypothetical protein